ALVPGLVLGDGEQILRLLEHVGAAGDADLDRGLQPVEELGLLAAVGAAQADADRLVALLDQIAAPDPRRHRARALRVAGVAALEAEVVVAAPERRERARAALAAVLERGAEEHAHRQRGLRLRDRIF